MKPKKRILFLLAIFLLLVISSLTIWMLNRKSPFRSFCDSLFIEEMQGDTLSLHYTLAWPNDFHINEKACLPTYSRENAIEGYEHTYDGEDYTRGAAFLIGNESRGLSDGISELADVRVRIPMAGKVESLNAAVAASILMYEAGRQRRAGKKDT